MGQDVSRAKGVCISIHALREEGDTGVCENLDQLFQFLSTPSARRATTKVVFEVGGR